MTQLAQIDENMVPGSTYTFQMKLVNLITSPSTSTVQNDLNSNAPDFVNNDLQVTVEDTLNPLSDIFDVQFTYNGDGTDVISDVGASIVAAIKAGSNDNFNFVAAVQAPASQIGGATSALSNAADSIGSAIKNAADSTTKTAAQAAQNVLTPIEVAVAIVVGLVVLLIFTSGKAGGVSASAEGVSVGGHR